MAEKHQGPSKETLAAEAAMVARFVGEDAAQKRLGFSLQRGKGRKNGARRKAEDRMDAKVRDSYAHNPKRRWATT